MPVDPSILLQSQPVQIQTPVQAAGQMLQLRNLAQGAQLQQAQLTGANLQNQTVQTQLDSQQAIRRALMDSGGDPAKLTTLATQYGALPRDVMALQTQQANVRKTFATATKAEVDAHTSLMDIGAGKLNAAITATDPQVKQAAWTDAIAFGQRNNLGNGAQMPQQYPGDDAAKALLGSMQTYSNVLKGRTVGAEETQAAARKTIAATGQTEAQAKIPGIEAQSDQQVRSNLSAQAIQAAQNGGPAGYTKFLGGLSADQQAMLPASWDGSNPKGFLEQLRQVGMTANQQTTAAHNSAEEQLGQKRNTIAQQNATTQRQRLGVEQYNAGLGPNSQPVQFRDGNGNLQNVSPSAMAIIQGKLDPQTTRAMLRRNPGLINQVMAGDANFDEVNIDKRYQTAQEFNSSQNSKAGGQVLALNTLIHHADLYLQVAQAMKNGQWQPGNAAFNAVATMFGKTPPTNAALVGQFLAGETAKLAQGGAPFETEVKAVTDKLGSKASPDQIAGAGKTLLQIGAGRAIPLKEKLEDAKLGNIYHVLGPDARAILQKNGFDPDTLKASDPSAAPSARIQALRQKYNY